jgi:hypothetical protein
MEQAVMAYLEVHDDDDDDDELYYHLSSPTRVLHALHTLFHLIHLIFLNTLLKVPRNDS